MSETTETRLKKYEMDVNQLTVEHLQNLIYEMQKVSDRKDHPMYQIVDNINPLELDAQSRRLATNIFRSVEADEVTTELVRNIESEWVTLPVRYDRELKKWVPVDTGEYHGDDIIQRLNLSVANSMGSGIVIRPYGHPE